MAYRVLTPNKIFNRFKYVLLLISWLKEGNKLTGSLPTAIKTKLKYVLVEFLKYTTTQVSVKNTCKEWGSMKSFKICHIKK